jgi:hypothetical protein
MDAADPLTAQGVPCAFEPYEVSRGEAWVLVQDGIPGRADRIRAGMIGPDRGGTW